MNPWLLAAALCTLLIAAVHSVMGERRIFQHLRQGCIVPSRCEPLLRPYQLRIVWASWHLVSCFGLAVTALLVVAAQEGTPPATCRVLTGAAVGILLLAAVLVAAATRGRHLSWLALSLTAAIALVGIGPNIR